MGPWMDFIFAKVIMGDKVENYTVAIGLFSMMTKSTANSLFMAFTAGCVLIAIPITILFIVMQRFYVRERDFWLCQRLEKTSFGL